MEKIEYKYEVLIKASNALASAIDLHKERYGEGSDQERATYVASVVQHFIIFHEMLWKFFKFFLSEKYGLETTGSRDVFICSSVLQRSGESLSCYAGYH